MLFFNDTNWNEIFLLGKGTKEIHLRSLACQQIGDSLAFAETRFRQMRHGRLKDAVGIRLTRTPFSPPPMIFQLVRCALESAVDSWWTESFERRDEYQRTFLCAYAELGNRKMTFTRRAVQQESASYLYLESERRIRSCRALSTTLPSFSFMTE